MLIDVTFDPRVSRPDGNIAAIIPSYENIPQGLMNAKPLHLYHFHDIDLRFADAQDKVLRKKELNQIEQTNRQLPNEQGAKKIIVFCNELHKAKQRYILYIYSRGGVKHSIKIFLGCIAPELGFLNTPESRSLQNKYFSRLLGKAYTELFKEQVKYDANANSKSALRR